MGLAVCALAALFWPRGEGTAPAGLLLDANGRSATLGSRLTPVSLVHFWATWCPPCLTEIPALQRLAGDLRGEHGFGVVLVAVADDREKVRGLLGEAGNSVLHDTDWEVARRYGTRKLPETYLVIRGEVVEKWAGSTDWDDPAVRAKLRAHVAGAGKPKA
ncbi:MAG TPA: TlpA disulfide reductase family protein [Thermoanaerobaculia bacterium]|nr:TlpA disulfide reductase family protein [Thermoanaerobaculia bacterium]